MTTDTTTPRTEDDPMTSTSPPCRRLCEHVADALNALADDAIDRRPDHADPATWADTVADLVEAVVAGLSVALVDHPSAGAQAVVTWRDRHGLERMLIGVPLAALVTANGDPVDDGGTVAMLRAQLAGAPDDLRGL
jgi:hypothetical protein